MIWKPAAIFAAIVILAAASWGFGAPAKLFTATWGLS